MVEIKETKNKAEFIEAQNIINNFEEVIEKLRYTNRALYGHFNAFEEEVFKLKAQIDNFKTQINNLKTENQALHDELGRRGQW